MSADHGNPVGLRRIFQPASTGAASASPFAQIASTMAIGPSAHRGDVGDIDHGAAPAGEPWIAGDEFVHEAFDGEQQIAIAVGDSSTIVADRNDAGT